MVSAEDETLEFVLLEPIYKRLRTYIFLNRLVLKQVAQKSGIPISKFYRYMDGTTALLADDLEKIIIALEQEPAFFLRRSS